MKNSHWAYMPEKDRERGKNKGHFGSWNLVVAERGRVIVYGCYHGSLLILSL